MSRLRRPPSHVPVLAAVLLGALACHPPPPEPEDSGANTRASASTEPAAPRIEPSPQEPPSESESPAASGGASAGASGSCVHGLADPPAPPANPVEECPAHPSSPPVMPSALVQFAGGMGAPELQVELAQTPAHRAHGLMFRKELADDEGMLFSWHDEAPRSFWMKNTCLALDMLFVAADGTIVGILRDVPPMNLSPRAVPCPAAHVLEVRAGWTKQYGIEPGQKLGVTRAGAQGEAP